MIASHVLIKPVSSECNLQCKYCFYEDEANKREKHSYGKMTLETAEQIIKCVFLDTERFVEFAFQGGEPTLIGLSFFEQFVELVEQYRRKKKLEVHYIIQTNGIVIEETWVAFLKKHDFLVGISMDGIKEVHDKMRVDREGKGTFQKVLRSIQLLEKAQIPFNILTVATKEMARRIEKIYHFYKKNGWNYQQYIPCLDPFGEERGNEEYSLTPKRYGEMLKTLFDLWFVDVIKWYKSGKKGSYISVRQFENYIMMLRGGQPESCAMSGRCSMQTVIEANGDVYSCDFYVMDSYRLGSIKEQNLKELYERSWQFERKSHEVSKSCQGCRWYPLCRGGCRRDREYMDGTMGQNYYCESYQCFFEYAIERLEYLAYLME